MGKIEPSVLNRHVLVFNKSWRLIDTTTVKDAIILMCRESAVGLCTHTYQHFSWDQWIGKENPPITERFVKSAHGLVPAPEAIILCKYDEVYHQTVAFTPHNLYRRDGSRCQYCGKIVAEDQLSIDHIIPRSKGGKSSFENCVVACLTCNNKKGDRLLEETTMKLLRKPVRPNWNPIIHVKPDNRPKSWQHFVKQEWWEENN